MKKILLATLLVTASLVASDSLKSKLIECSQKKDNPSKLACYDTLTNTLETNQKAPVKLNKIETVDITGTAFEKDTYDGRVTAICRGDTIIFEPQPDSSNSTSKVIWISLTIAQGNLLYATYEGKMLAGDTSEGNKLLEEYYEKIRNVRKDLASLQEAKGTYYTKCDLTGNYSISNIPKGVYNIYAFIKDTKTGGYISVGITKDITKNEKIILTN